MLILSQNIADRYALWYDESDVSKAKPTGPGVGQKACEEVRFIMRRYNSYLRRIFAVLLAASISCEIILTAI